MRKLDETEQNLLRVNDIVTEVKRQIGSLERQANKARRYKEVFEELKLKETDLAGIDKANFLKQKKEVLRRLEELRKEESVLAGAVGELEAKIANRQSELKALEESLMSGRSQILNLENSLVRNNEHIVFNQQRIAELDGNNKILESQIEQSRGKLVQDEEKLGKVRVEYDNLKQNIEDKQLVLKQKEEEINKLGAAIKSSLEAISESKKVILDLETRISNTHNEVNEFNSKHQVFLARKKRLEVEKAKVYEEKAIAEEALNKVTQELASTRELVECFRQKISKVKVDLEQEGETLTGLTRRSRSARTRNLPWFRIRSSWRN